MKREKNILIAFLLNLGFSVFELIGGILTGSVAIASDAVHDLGDAAGIGVAYFMEKTSRKQPDGKYTYGYGRYSVLGGIVTTLILLFGSAAVIYNAIHKIINPTEIHYEGMMLFALIGVAVNLGAAYATRSGDSVNQKAVNLHMLEDVLGWAVVLVGAVVMRFTDFVLLDPLLSIGVAVFILINAGKNLAEALGLFLEKIPHDISIEEVEGHLLMIEGVLDVHHIHIWSMDGRSSYATIHIVTDQDGHQIKDKVRAELKEHGIVHATLELETPEEHCHEKDCHTEVAVMDGHCHHHHHHHH